MNSSGFNELMHAPNRLQICGLLNPVAEMEFRAIKELLGVSDSVLSKHIKVLLEESYIQQVKRVKLGRPKTWLSMTDIGRQAFKAHVKALQEILGEAV